MALFKKTKEPIETSKEVLADKEKDKKEQDVSEHVDMVTKNKVEHTARVSFAGPDNILRRPRVTEKSTELSSHNAYVFEVDKRSNKKEIIQAVIDIYKVKPIKVHTLPYPSKSVMSRRGQKGVKPGGKKAIVYLKKGDTIEII